MSQTDLPAVRSRLRFDDGWLFHLGDVPIPPVHGHGATYGACKASRALGAAAWDYDDSDWRVLSLPHDWQVEQDFRPEENLDHGYKPRGIAWYRRHFRLDPGLRAASVRVILDGVATHCTVWVNGQLLARNHCGYTGFEVDLSDVATHGDRIKIGRASCRERV